MVLHYTTRARRLWLGCIGYGISTVLSAQTVSGDEPALGAAESRIQQNEIANNAMLLEGVRRAGLKIFATQFRNSDGFGDGPVNPANTIDPGGRPTLQNNGTFLRVNGLDAQSCLDCHTVVSSDTMPFTAGVGGAGNFSNAAMFKARAIDVEDQAGNGYASFDGRLINPLALFGTGGVQLVAREMTRKLQQLRQEALDNPGTTVQLNTKGVYFGSIVADAQGTIDTSNVEGIDADLVVRPFGRKGEFASVREFDVGALMFHLGMEPVEAVGLNVDGDGDGVVNEVGIGEMSALEIFVTTQDTPRQLPMDADATSGFRRFNNIGCSDCHRPFLSTWNPTLEYSFPEIPDDPTRNTFYAIDLSAAPPAFETHNRGGLIVRLFSDLKRHDMGPELAESFHDADERQNREFITAKLWGVADTAPYLHDGRALTLNEAILLHGGEAAGARDAYAALSKWQKNQIIAFLRTLRNPATPNADVLN